MGSSHAWYTNGSNMNAGGVLLNLTSDAGNRLQANGVADVVYVLSGGLAKSVGRPGVGFTGDFYPADNTLRGVGRGAYLFNSLNISGTFDAGKKAMSLKVIPSPAGPQMLGFGPDCKYCGGSYYMTADFDVELHAVGENSPKDFRVTFAGGRVSWTYPAGVASWLVTVYPVGTTWDTTFNSVYPSLRPELPSGLEYEDSVPNFTKNIFLAGNIGNVAIPGLNSGQPYIASVVGFEDGSSGYISHTAVAYGSLKFTAP